MNDMIMWSPGVTLDAIEKQTILIALSHYRGNKTATANSLGIAARTLDYKLEKYEADKKDEAERNEQRRKEQHDFLIRSRGDAAGINAAAAAGYVIKPALAETNVPSASAGVRVEPVVEVTAKQPVPVSKREEVQSVLPKQTSKSGNKRSG